MSMTEAMYSALEFAHAILDMNDRIAELEREVAHYKELHRIHTESAEATQANLNDMTRSLLVAAIDPESTINKGARARHKLELMGAITY